MKKLILLLAMAMGGSDAAFGATAQSLVRPGDQFALIGDSITEQGYRIPVGYYHLMTNALAQAYPGQGCRVADLGFSGITMDGWNGIEKQSRTKSVPHLDWDVKAEISRHVDIITILLGMNDILCPTVRDDPATWDAWREQGRTLIRALRQRTTPRIIILCTVTPLTADPSSPKNRVRDALNQRLRELAVEERCLVASTGEAIAELISCCRELKQGYQPVPDFVHPQALGHTALALAIARTLNDGALMDIFSRRYAEQINALLPKDPSLTYWLAPDRINQADDAMLTYRLSYTWNDGAIATSYRIPTVTLKVPEGWQVSIPSFAARSETFTIRGTPTALRTPIELTATAGKDVTTQTVYVPMPWRVAGGFDNPKAWDNRTYQPDLSVPASEAALVAGKGFDQPLMEGGRAYPWTLNTATIDYTGFDNPNALDPYGFIFGWQNDAFYAVRWVYSEKARPVQVRLSHATFSATLGLRLWVNGQRVATVDLNRQGKNQAETQASLAAGWNTLLIRCDHLEWQRQFACELLPLAGDSLTALRYSWRQPK